MKYCLPISTLEKIIPPSLEVETQLFKSNISTFLLDLSSAYLKWKLASLECNNAIIESSIYKPAVILEQPYVSPDEVNLKKHYLIILLLISSLLLASTLTVFLNFFRIEIKKQC